MQQKVQFWKIEGPLQLLQRDETLWHNVLNRIFYSKSMEEFTPKMTAVIHHHDIGYYGNQDCITTSI